ncbi:MAG: hypothetical protein QOG67_2347 [Verrucomicrobiota bacterium]
MQQLADRSGTNTVLCPLIILSAFAWGDDTGFALAAGPGTR